ncbi:hypothetical protein HK101_004632 [Irineochytrium annulatum]|nr:hypothetical protein HK101_004632 [Irineochytrium annulatum]
MSDYEGYSQGGRSGALIIDLKSLTSLSVDTTTRTAVVGAGTILAPLYYTLATTYGLALPGGTCPTVGVSGLTLGGGYGMLGRKWGMTLDSALSFRVVLADGSVVVADGKGKNKDLYWALRGAGGGSFGVVTSITYQLYQTPKKVTTFTYDYDAKDYVKVMNAYAKWGMSASADVTTEMAWDKKTLELQGTFLGPKSQLNALLKPFTDAAGQPGAKDVQEGAWVDAALRWTWMDGKSVKDLLQPNAQDARYMKGNSILYQKQLSRATLDIANKYLSTPPKDATGAYLIVDLWGGSESAVNKIPVEATSFVHRSIFMGFELVVEWGDASAKPGVPDCQACLKWIGDFWNELAAQYRKENNVQVVPAYQNYIDKNNPDWLESYYGSAVPKLKQVKKSVDPTNLFNFPQSIPLPPK